MTAALRPTGTCRACGAAIIRALLGRKYVELSASPVEQADADGGEAAAMRDATGTIRARYMSEDNPRPDPWETLLELHATECPARPGNPADRQPLQMAIPPVIERGEIGGNNIPTASSGRPAGLAEVLPFRRPDPARRYQGRA